MGFQTQSGPASTHDKQDMTTINQKQWKYVPMLAYDRQVARQLLAIVTAPTWAPQGEYSDVIGHREHINLKR